MKIILDEQEVQNLLVEALKSRGYELTNAIEFKDGADDFINVWAHVDVGAVPEMRNTDQ